MEKATLIITVILLTLASCNTAKEEIRTDFKKYFDEFDVEGTFVLYNEPKDKYIYYNKESASKGFIPASTFKIYNSLIGLETEVIKDKFHVILWDSVYREREVINKDQDLESAYKNSALWFYQKLARQVGQEQMKHWIDTLCYGNKDTSAGIDVFWIEGGLRISPVQQVNLLVKLKNNELPFSNRSIDIVKEIMLSDHVTSFPLRTKTGWGKQDNRDVGWYVGYYEINDNVYYFAICIQPKNTRNKDFLSARIKIVDSIINDLGLLKE